MEDLRSTDSRTFFYRRKVSWNAMYGLLRYRDNEIFYNIE